MIVVRTVNVRLMDNVVVYASVACVVVVVPFWVSLFIWYFTLSVWITMSDLNLIRWMVSSMKTSRDLLSSKDLTLMTLFSRNTSYSTGMKKLWTGLIARVTNTGMNLDKLRLARMRKKKFLRPPGCSITWLWKLLILLSKTLFSCGSSV